MPTDLHERLADFRDPLDDAIAFDLAHRPAAAARLQPRGSHVLIAAAAGIVVLAGIAALAWTASDRSGVSPGPAVIDQPETTLRESAAPVAPGPTAASTNDTVPAGAVIERLAIGDSVMLGAASQLANYGFVVDAVEGRSFADGLDAMRTLKAQGRLGDVVVVHLGSNGSISKSDMSAMMEALADVPQVLLLTVDIPHDYAAGNNPLIYDTARNYPNVVLLDWAALSDTCPHIPPYPVPPTSDVQADCFYADGIHLRPDGRRYYADVINGNLTLISE